MVFIVIVGLDTSSNKYNRRRDGSASVIKITAGERVQMASSSWFSYRDFVVKGVDIKI